MTCPYFYNKQEIYKRKYGLWYQKEWDIHNISQPDIQRYYYFPCSSSSPLLSDHWTTTLPTWYINPARSQRLFNHSLLQAFNTRLYMMMMINFRRYPPTLQLLALGKRPHWPYLSESERKTPWWRSAYGTMVEIYYLLWKKKNPQNTTTPLAFSQKILTTGDGQILRSAGGGMSIFWIPVISTK